MKPNPRCVDNAKKITMRGAPLALVKVVAADRHHLLLAPVLFQQLSAEGKETGIRKAVVFKNNRFFYLLENPIETAGHTTLTTQINFAEVRQHFARPIHPIDDLSRGRAGFVIIAPRGLGPSATTRNVCGRALAISTNTRAVVSGRLKIKKATGDFNFGFPGYLIASTYRLSNSLSAESMSCIRGWVETRYSCAKAELNPTLRRRRISDSAS